MTAAPKDPPKDPPRARPHDRPRRAVHGRRAARSLRPAARALLDQLLPRLEILLPPPGGTIDPATLFDAPGAGTGLGRPLWLEIGFGAGEHLAWQAECHPEVGLIGAEVFIQGVARLLRRIADAGLANTRLFRGDAMALVAALPPAALARVFILFPDPWPKTRHHKRRIVQGETLDLLAEVMCPGAELRLATDDADYAAWILERLIAHPAFDWLARRPRDWRQRPPDWPPTRYEAKALAQGRQPIFLRFRRRPLGPSHGGPPKARKALQSAGFRG